MIETLPLATPQNEFVSDAFEQSTEFVGTAAGAEATAVLRRTQPKQTTGWTGARRVATAPPLTYVTTPKS